PRGDHLTHRLARVLPRDLLRIRGHERLDRLDELGAPAGGLLTACRTLGLEGADLLLRLLAQLGGAGAQRRDVTDDLRLLEVLAQVLEQSVQLVLRVLRSVQGGLSEVEE